MKTDFVERIQLCLKKKNLSQSELAEKLGIRRENFTYWKNNNTYPNCDILYKMADILEADPRWLVVGEVSLDREKAMITDREFKHILRYREIPDDLKPIVDDFLELVAKRKPLSDSEQGL